MEPLPFETPVSHHYTNPVAADDRTGPWPDVATACLMVLRAVRLPGLVVDIQAPGGPVVKHWWPGPGLENEDIVPYLPEPTPAPPATGNGSAGRGTYLSLPGRYTATNFAHALRTGTKDVDLIWETGRTLEPGTDYVIDTAADPPTVTIVASLAQFENRRIWGYDYRNSSRTKIRLPDPYAANYPAQVLPEGTADIGVFWASGRQLEPGIDYTFEPASRTLTLLADVGQFGGSYLWLWLYS